jgi:sarcosine oxidase subunit beta
VTEAQWEAQVYRLARRIPSLRIPNERKGVVDLYDCSDDWIPIYDRSSVDGFYMAIGTSGNQFKNAPVVGPRDGRADRPVEHGHDHDKRPGQGEVPLHGPRARHGVLLAPARDQPELELLGQRLS